MTKIILVLLSTMLLLALGAGNSFAYAQSDIQNNGEPYLTAILNQSYGVGNYHEVTNTNEFEFNPGNYVSTVLEDKHAAYKDPTGWYNAGSLVTHNLYTDPQNQLEQVRQVTATSTFGLYINSDDGNTYYSKASLNPDKSIEPEKGKHAKLFIIDQGTDKGAYVLGFEDVNRAHGSDWDYNDVVVELKGAQLSIPEFPTVAIPVAGVLGLLFVFGRKKEGL